MSNFEPNSNSAFIPTARKPQPLPNMAQNMFPIIYIIYKPVPVLQPYSIILLNFASPIHGSISNSHSGVVGKWWNDSASTQES